jgi:predicted Holliday junction resolvase-like endonuclease
MEIAVLVILLLCIITAFLYYLYATLKGNVQGEARNTFENWRQTELSTLKNQYESQVQTLSTQYQSQLSAAIKQYENQLEEAKKQTELALDEKYKGLFSQWCIDKEVEIRQDAVARSQAVVLGRVTEHIAPYLPEFELNPRDARFIGSPIDLIVFNGLTEGDLKNIVFVEVKSGESQISTRERKIRDIVKEGLVEWRELRIQTSQNHKAEETSNLQGSSPSETPKSTS